MDFSPIKKHKKSKPAVLGAVSLILKILPQASSRFLYRSFCRFPPTRRLIQGVFYTSIPDTITIGEAIVALNKNDPVISGTLASDSYEKGELNLFKSRIKPGMTIIDIGANLGCFSAVAGVATGPEGKVISFEPEPDNFNYLKKTVALNPLGNIFCHQLAVSDRNEFGKLFVSKINSGDHRLYVAGQDRKAINIQTTALDSFLAKEGITKIDIIKMDIQGHEGRALMGMMATLAANPSVEIFTEFCPSFLDRSGFGAKTFFDLLRSLDFNVNLIDPRHGTFSRINEIEPIIDSCVFEGFVNLYCRR